MRLYTTANLPSNLMQRSFAANLMRMQPNGNAPLFAISGLARSQSIAAVAHSYWSKTLVFPKVTLNGAHTNSVTTLTVLDSSEVEAGSLLLNETWSAGTWSAPELIYITSVDSATSLTVVRGYGGTTGTAMLDADVLIETGNTFEEGSSQPVARAVTQAEHTNFTQIFRNTWDATRTAKQVKLESGVQLEAENQEDAMFFHGMDIEYNTIWGRKGTTTINGRPARTMDGIEAIVEAFAPGNLAAAGSTTTYAQLEAMLDPLFDTIANGRGATNHRTLYVGSLALQVINEIGRASGYFELVPNQTSFGMQFHTFRTTRGTFDLIEHSLLNAHASTKGMCIVADLSSFDYQYLQETMHEDSSTPGQDATSGVFTTEVTMEITNPLGWGIIYGLTAGA